MGQVREIQDDWSGGCKQDQGIEAVPANAAWEITNMLPGVGGFALGLRGPYTYASCDVGVRQPIYAGATSSGSYIYMTDDGSRMWRISASTGAVCTYQNLAGDATQNGVDFNGQMYFTNGSSPAYYTASSTQYTTLSATAPRATLAAVYKARLALANDGTNTNRIWFSGIYDTTSTTAWATGATGRWIDTGYPITALASLQNSMLVFSNGHVERIRGTTPGGGGQAGDIVLEPLFDTGIVDSRQVTVAEDKCYFLNDQGVYMTDGANLIDLAEQGGMSRPWQAVTRSLAKIAYASGWLFLIGSGDSWMVNVQKRAWYGLSFGDGGVYGNGAITVQSAADEAYLFKDATVGVSESRLVGLSSTLGTQSSSHDPDGSAITGTLQSRAFAASLRQKRFRRFFARYEATDPGSANPVINVQPNYDPIIEPGSDLTSGTGIVLPETSGADTARGAMSQKGRSVAFHIATSGKGYPVGIQQIGVEAHELEPTRLN